MTIQATPRSRAGELALAIYGHVLERVRGDRLVAEAMSIDGDRLVVQSRAFDLAEFERIWIVAVGKAAGAMAAGAASVLGDRLDGGLIVTKYGHGIEVAGLETIEAGHPVPDEASLAAGERVIELADSRQAGDFVIFLLSGGASALVEAPANGISLDDLRETNEMLLASGAEIGLINAVRSRISNLKGGRLAAAFAPATCIVLALSDVVGNVLASIGSGPFLAPSSSARIPAGLIDRLPPAVRSEILSFDLLPRIIPSVPHFVVGSVSLAVHAAVDAAKSHGIEPYAYQDPMRGDAAEMARQVMALAVKRAKSRAGDFCLVFGGETTVKLKRSAKGVGGRCQEMAVAAAPILAGLATSSLSGAAFLAAGTDGTDGPTDAAGGLVELDSVTVARAAGFSASEALAAHDSYPFLAAAGGLIITGPTGSNVNDLCLFVQA